MKINITQILAALVSLVILGGVAYAATVFRDNSDPDETSDNIQTLTNNEMLDNNKPIENSINDDVTVPEDDVNIKSINELVHVHELFENTTEIFGAPKSESENIIYTVEIQKLRGIIRIEQENGLIVYYIDDLDDIYRNQSYTANNSVRLNSESEFALTQLENGMEVILRGEANIPSDEIDGESKNIVFYWYSGETG